MSDINSVKTQIQSLINLANETTGNTDTNLTDGVNALISGYGQGGSGGNIFGIKHSENALINLLPVLPILSIKATVENSITQDNVWHTEASIAVVTE